MRVVEIRMKRLFSGQRFTCFLLGLASIYMIVWLAVFQKQTKENEVRSNHLVAVEANSDRSCDCDDDTVPILGRQFKSLPDTSNQTIFINDSQPRYEKFMVKGFDPNHPKMLLVLAYQRVGSSFFGKMFDLNQDMFYVYEPLDALYQALYGTTSGYSIPSDITSHRNGSDRLLPCDEIVAVEQFIQNLLSCDLKKLPSEFFVHSFWSFLATFMPSWKTYHQCLVNTTMSYGRKKCAGLIKCPKRFGTQPWNSYKCKVGLWDTPPPQHDDNKQPDSFGQYKKCMDNVVNKATPCVDFMNKKCRSTQFRATKTVRATMESVEELMLNNPNLRVIHLFRDPRPVVVSRMTTDTYHGLYSKDAVKESHLYCSILLRDLKKRQELEEKYEGRFFEVIYEDFVKNPAEYTQSVYKFLDIDIPEELIPWVKEHTKGKKQLESTKSKSAPKWKRTLTVEQAESILSNCREFYDMVQYDFH